MTVPPAQQIDLGAARVTVVNVGDFDAPLWTDWLRLTPAQWAELGGVGPMPPARMPILCFHVALPGRSILIDAGLYPDPFPPAYAIPGYAPPPGLLPGLRQHGVDPREVETVIITHAHFDHFNGLAAPGGAPHFPRARHLLGRADWEAAAGALADPQSPEALNLGAVARAGLLELTDGDVDLGGGVRVVASPGESPGHQHVRIQLGAEVVYFLGDLYHHAAEVEHPGWCPFESDRDALQESRRRFAGAALAEGALLFAPHFASAGRLAPAAGGVRWEPAIALG